MTDVYSPQSDADPRKFVKSFDSDGTANFDQVGFTDLDFTATFGAKASLLSSMNACANSRTCGSTGFIVLPPVREDHPT